MIKTILDVGAVLIPIVIIGLVIENLILRVTIRKLKGIINENNQKSV